VKVRGLKRSGAVDRMPLETWLQKLAYPCMRDNKPAPGKWSLNQNEEEEEEVYSNWTHCTLCTTFDQNFVMFPSYSCYTDCAIISKYCVVLRERNKLKANSKTETIRKSKIMLLVI